MLRRNFPDILKSIDVSPVDLYRNLVKVFFEERVEVFDGEYSFVAYSLYDWCKKEFRQFPYKCFTVSIEEFNDKTHLNHLRNIPYNDDVATDSLITLCEYILNFLSTIRFPKELIEEHDLTLELINVILDELHFMKTQDEKGIFMIVSANPAIIMVSSMVEEDIAIQLIKYTHHSMKENLNEKARILSFLAKHLEAKKDILKKEASGITNAFFNGENNFDIRHDNVTEGFDYYRAKFATLSDREKEEYYDRVFRLGVSLFSILESIKDKDEIKQLMKE